MDSIGSKILGSRVRDNITGFEGIAIGFHMWLHGCNRVSIQPTELKDGKTIPAESFDEQQVEVVKVQPPVISPTSVARSGGPHHEPPRRPDPMR